MTAILFDICLQHWLGQCFSTFLLPRNPTQTWRSLTEPHAHWSVSRATYARMKLQGVYGLISLAGHWGQSRQEDDKADKYDQYEILTH